MNLAPHWMILALGSALFAALTTIFIKLGVAEVNSNMATLLRSVVIVVLALLVVGLRHEWQPVAVLSGRGALLLVLSGITTGLSWLCYNRALQLAPASRVAPIDKLSVALVVLLGVLLLGEKLNLATALGAILVTAGVLLLTLAA